MKGSRVVANNAREKSLELINLEITHKMKHMLMVIQTSLTNVNEYLPTLIQTYKIARDHQLNVGNLHQKSLEMLQSILVSTKQDAKRAKFALDLFNFMLQEDQWVVNVKVPVSVQTVWQSAVANYPFANKKQRAQVTDSFDDFIIMADPMLLEKVFLMLLNNICKRIDNEDLWQLTIETRKDENWNYLLLKDNGDVLSAEVLPHLFDRVYYADQGMLLGCFACQKSLQLMGGEIACFVTAQSKTMFQLQFPMVNV